MTGHAPSPFVAWASFMAFDLATADLGGLLGMPAPGFDLTGAVVFLLAFAAWALFWAVAIARSQARARAAAREECEQEGS